MPHKDPEARKAYDKSYAKAYYKTDKGGANRKAAHAAWRSKPENAALHAGLKGYHSAENRAKRFGGDLTTDPVEQELMRKMYRVVHHMNKLYGPRTWSVDHIHPLSKGGAHRLSNMQILPLVDNSRKYNSV